MKGDCEVVNLHFPLRSRAREEAVVLDGIERESSDEILLAAMEKAMMKRRRRKTKWNSSYQLADNGAIRQQQHRNSPKNGQSVTSTFRKNGFPF
ncbi:hypothetical protein CRG98_040416 [Punica granatum]|uniref:Uncharacterized protein n=1 Tax=Punica granatum TaxID=22663 RepID=A0A2I0I5D8_PUNGR|nr:hypothetical protein CRG98_040416 [Punica granatum]